MKARVLTPETVHAIRTSGLTDPHWARVLGVSCNAVRLARVGRTWKSHPTPPDIAARVPTGKYKNNHIAKYARAA